MKKVASLAVGAWFVFSAAGCCCSHLFGGNQCCGYGPSVGPAFAPAGGGCPGGACGYPGAMAPGVYQGAYIGSPSMTAAVPVSGPTIAVATQPTYASYRPTAVAATESLPTY